VIDPANTEKEVGNQKIFLDFNVVVDEDVYKS
jgi:hypothetical protein